MGARFVRLGIAGFKSFADQVSLELLPGLTGVVGPNGCGKSNVADALRWAMGEGNARHLRGGEMDDVIFAGSANRPSRNLAEVSLTVEDDEAGLPSPFAGQAELNVVRRLERGAGSTYRVNGREARARDVQTLFADLASGARSSALVSQGRVSSLVNARPEDRRAVLEEAAGITGLHARRAEAETRLRAAEANLERAEERRLLLERQLEGLRGQAKQANRYRTVATQVLEAEATYLAIQEAIAESVLDAAEAGLAKARDAVQRAKLATAEASRQEVQDREALPPLRDAEAAARTELDRARLVLEGQAAEMARAEAALAAATQRQAQIARDMAHAETVLADAESAATRLDLEEKRLHAADAAHPDALAEAEAEAAEAAATLQDADQAERHAAAEAAEAGARRAAASQILHLAESRDGRARQSAAKLDAERVAALSECILPERLDDAAAAVQTADTTLQASRAAEEQADAGRAGASQRAAAARAAQAECDTARHKLAAERTALSDVLGVKDGERWPPMVDAMTVPPGLETALGAALGEELAAAADPASARHWRPMPPLSWPATTPGQALSATIEAPALLDRALSGIRLVGSEAEGEAAQPGLMPGQSLVSVSGAVWRWDGYTVRAGTPTAAAVRLRQRNRLRSLSRHLDAAEKSSLAARHEREAADRASHDAATADAAARLARRNAEAACDKARSANDALRSRAELTRTRLAALDAQLHLVGPEAQTASQALETARQAHAALPDPARLKLGAETARATLQAARMRDSAASRALDGLNRAAQDRRTRRAAIVQERADRHMRTTDLAERVVDLRARARDIAAELDRLSAQPAQAADAAEQARARCNHLQSAFEASEAARQAAEQALENSSAAARAAGEAEYGARDALTRAEVTRTSLTDQRASTQGRIDERRPALPPFPTITDASPAAEDRARARLQRLQRERDEMGPVNLRADIEAEAIGTEIATIIHEREELATAIAKLRGSIGHLNREGRERLTAVFNQVDRHFQTLFATMFGGGRAHLGLVGSDDPLLAGLEIYAQPPGKKLSTLSLLSGGEQALTALSLIFAVFRCNPAPLCVLDEVDAPLDDANVERLCNLLAEMARAGGTRFLVVTHNQLTMARMDRLYGVTMQERGVSRLLSVDLSDAVEMVEAIAAE